MKKVIAKIPEIFAPLMTQKYRIKLCYGGRAGGKSYAFADSLLLLGRQKKLLIACLREIQDSIKDSVHKLLSDRISFYGLSDYRVAEDRIDNRLTGTRFIFKGLREQDSQKIKSLEGVDIAWIEEAQTISKKSWESLEPNVRTDGSEIWTSMNRLFENDPIWTAVAANPDRRTWIRRVNYCDNPFCPEEMRLLAEKCRRENMEKYRHVWLGAPLAQGAERLIGAAAVRQAFTPKIASTTSPLIVGLDIARFGDDKTVFCFRKGRLVTGFESYAGKSNVEVANIATNIIGEKRPVRLFMDIGGQGAGVYDILKDRGFGEVIRGVYFGEKALQADRYFNRRAEMWDKINRWLTELPLPELPADEDLFDELTAVNKKFDGRGRLQLEDKEDIKKRLGRSPDKADALALTFAEPVYDYGVPRLYGNGKVPVEEMFALAKKSSGGGW